MAEDITVKPFPLLKGGTVNKPYTKQSVPELTVRGIILGGIITLMFTAANVYLGLKVGLTFATSIPAAVISMAVLHRFKNHTIQENNIVQTIASAAGTLSAIIFVLPALIMVGYWNGFPYLTTVLVCMIGGILGVMYSIPLRRALVTGSDLPYPEGVAAAEVLKVGDSEGGSEANRQGMMAIIWGGIVSAVYMLLGYMKVMASSWSLPFKVGAGGTMIGGGLSFALLGVGHLVGITVGVAMLVGLVIAYGVLLPYFTSGQVVGGAEVAEVVGAVFKSDVRLVGAGAMAIAAIWTLIKIIGPIARGISEAARSAGARKAGEEVALTELDIPIKIVGGVILASMLPIGFLLWDFISHTHLHQHLVILLIVTLLFVLLIGIVIASVCGYMAGLIGASNSPISGVGILVVIVGALLIKASYGPASGEEVTQLIGFTLFTAAIVFGIATISNDNLQDLKTGQLVEATPWKQQVALIIGVVFGSAIIPPILELMHKAFNFVGAPGAGEGALAAPQAAIMSTLAEGIFKNDLNWNRIGLGVVLGLVAIIIDECLRRVKGKGLALPPLAVGMGLYLPQTSTLMIAIGAVIGYCYDRWADKNPVYAPERKRLGVLLSTGLIVGESLFGVVYAAIVGAAGTEEPLAVVGEGFALPAQVLGILVFVVITIALYRYVGQKGAQSGSETLDSETSK